MKMKLVDHHPAPCTVLGVFNADQACVTAVRVLVVLRMMNDNFNHHPHAQWAPSIDDGCDNYDLKDIGINYGETRDHLLEVVLSRIVISEVLFSLAGCFRRQMLFSEAFVSSEGALYVILPYDYQTHPLFEHTPVLNNNFEYWCRDGFVDCDFYAD